MLTECLLLEDLQRKFSSTKSNSHRRAMNPDYRYDSFNLMTDLSIVVREMIDATYRCCTDSRSDKKEIPGFGIILYGSPARYEMTNYSDIDIHIIDSKPTRESAELKSGIANGLAAFGFGKIDDPEWRNLDIAELYAAKSIIEGNQIIDSEFVCGDTEIAKNLATLKIKYDSLEWRTKNMFFQQFYLDHYYSRRNLNTTNVKYCVGGSRELLTFDWFDKAMNYTDPNWDKGSSDLPWIKKAIDNLVYNKLIDESTYNSLYRAVNFVVLLRNEVLHANQDTAEQGYTHLDAPTLERVWKSGEVYFQSLGIERPQHISELFERERKIVRHTKELMLEHIIAQEKMKRGNSWGKALDDILNPDTSYPARIELAHSEDNLLQIASVWGAHYQGNSQLFEELAKLYSAKDNWEVLASLACSQLCPQEVLDEIAMRCIEQTGLGYILRIIGRNKNTSRQTLLRIASEPRLGKRYKIVAQLNLERGIDYATNRA